MKHSYSLLWTQSIKLCKNKIPSKAFRYRPRTKPSFTFVLSTVSWNLSNIVLIFTKIYGFKLKVTLPAEVYYFCWYLFKLKINVIYDLQRNRFRHQRFRNILTKDNKILKSVFISKLFACTISTLLGTSILLTFQCPKIKGERFNFLWSSRHTLVKHCIILQSPRVNQNLFSHSF